MPHATNTLNVKTNYILSWNSWKDANIAFKCHLTGQYVVHLPDCRTQIVDYFVDEYKQVVGGRPVLQLSLTCPESEKAKTFRTARYLSLKLSG